MTFRSFQEISQQLSRTEPLERLLFVVFALKLQSCVGDLRPAVFFHVFPVVGVQGVHVPLQHPVIVAVDHVCPDSQFPVFPDQRLFHADFLQCAPQIAEQHPQAVVLRLLCSLCFPQSQGNFICRTCGPPETVQKLLRCESFWTALTKRSPPWRLKPVKYSHVKKRFWTVSPVLSAILRFLITVE